ncbi:MAG: HAMP domain-containing protein [Gemmatimonadota bacterium]|nr:MAG: HAMP domain-containing protein [Gemmatimonadota bacterium]
MRPRSLSLRSKFTLIVLGGAVLPLALLGLWLNRTAERSGEELLRARLGTSLGQIVDEIGLRWLGRRSQLLRLAESSAVQTALRENSPSRETEDAAQIELGELFAGMRDAVESATVEDASGVARWSVPSEGPATSGGTTLGNPALLVRLGIYDNATGARLGRLDARVSMSSLLPGGAGWGGVSGSVLAVFDRGTGASLLPLSIDPALFAGDRFVWGEEPWLTVRHTLHEPPMHLVLAAPLTPFTEPFQQAARRNIWILAIVALAVFALATLLTRRTTRALVRLAAAAEAVSHGDLERKVEEAPGDEVGRVARAFNSMTESLRRTLRELSQRQALAAVGEFAASLAHEVRNPLTSIRLDLQRVEEKLPQDSDARELLGRALGEVERVDRSVTGALRVARSGSVTLEPVDIRQPLESAIHSAEPELKAHGGMLEQELGGADPLWVKGDAPALEQLFLNLLLNAAQALDEGGRVEVTVARYRDGVSISIRDTGRGIPLENIERIFEPFYSTRPEGTGLGLAIAQRIATAHGGELEIESTPGAGSTVRLRLPGSPPA